MIQLSEHDWKSGSAPRTVLLFYDGYERHAEEGRIPRIYADGRRIARYAYRTLQRKQVWTGFYAAFKNLVASLEALGVRVRVNDFATARANPSYPIGISGYTSVLDKVRLPNPAVFGPGDFGLPPDVARARAQNNIKIFTQPGAWLAQIYRDELGDDIHPMPVAIDTDHWVPHPSADKTIDFIVYDKIRWRRPQREKDLLQPVLDHLRKRGLTCRILRYGGHHVSQFRAAIRESRALIFICEHETQGLAYQEAMASGLPVLAWDEGELVDPDQSKFLKPDITVSSVPYFDDRCGMTFKIGTFEPACDAFVARLNEFKPRDYVVENLSQPVCARRYLALYEQLFTH